MDATTTASSTDRENEAPFIIMDGTCANPTWISPDCRQVSSAKRSYPPVPTVIDHMIVYKCLSRGRPQGGRAVFIQQLRPCQPIMFLKH
eukprot:scaffold7554_cov72-Skeletonema_dohrnii-CCMP3373.AAC.1